MGCIRFTRRAVGAGVGLASAGPAIAFLQNKEIVMVRRVLPFCALALFAFLAAPVRADDTGAKPGAKANTHEGVVVSTSENKLVMKDKEGKTEHTHTVARDARITCDGKECKLEDLKKGTFIRVTTGPDNKMVVRIDASTKPLKEKPSK
jgi:hypothetical protein